MSNIDTIADRILCVGLRSSCFGTEVQDERETALATERNGARKGAFTTKKTRLKEPIAPIKAVIASARKRFNYMTLPGLTQGERVVASVKLPEIREMKDTALREIRGHVDKLIREWDYWVEEDRKILGSGWDRRDYPTDPERLRAEFDLRLSVTDLPRGEFTRVMGVMDDDLAALQQQYRDALSEMVNAGRNEVYQNLVGLIRHIADRLADPDASRFHDTLFDNLHQYLALVPSLNISNDPTLEALRSSASAQLGRLRTEDIRYSADRRAQVAAVAVDILNRSASLGSGRRIAV